MAVLIIGTCARLSAFWLWQLPTLSALKKKLKYSYELYQWNIILLQQICPASRSALTQMIVVSTFLFLIGWIYISFTLFSYQGSTDIYQLITISRNSEVSRKFTTKKISYTTTILITNTFLSIPGDSKSWQRSMNSGEDFTCCGRSVQTSLYQHPPSL